MSEWKTIGEIAEIYDGPHATPKKIENGYYFLSISSLSNGNLDLSKSAKICEEDYKKWTKRIVPIEGDLLFSYETRLGEAALMPANLKACLGRRMGLLRPNLNFVRSDFLLFAWLSPEFQKVIKQNTITGATVERIALSELSDFPILLPSLFEQEKIVKILTKLDQKIAINNQINEELEAMAKTLYDYWFVQFDFPDENGKPYKSSGGKMVYNDQLKREIPEGWGVKLLGELSTYVTDKISSNDLNSKNYIGTDNMLSNMKGIEQATYLPNSTLVNSFIPNDILIANIRPYFKKIWISDRTGGCSSDVLCLRANDKEICNYLFYSLARDDFFNYNVTGSKGSKMPRGDKAHIQKYSVLFSEKHALKFSKLVSNFISQKHLIYKQNQELSQLRDWLLPMLMNGQVRVEE
ncbi:restriction endonuclease subunit S [Streptococcus suis]